MPEPSTPRFILARREICSRFDKDELVDLFSTFSTSNTFKRLKQLSQRKVIVDTGAGFLKGMNMVVGISFHDPFVVKAPPKAPPSPKCVCTRRASTVLFARCFHRATFESIFS
ncbi:hypothetical protein BIW11_02682 [Tropilaelaps mercedesae]|uniref:Uncharacterized protein n=1 Tax=Tropilaelaps mercedesae TaxID=418985 RepID=A0A1V9XZ13_9ACAR|nr:hypothetical protein BIW11_02682 [Tropilaelaps mercedesae]